MAEDGKIPVADNTAKDSSEPEPGVVPNPFSPKPWSEASNTTGRGKPAEAAQQHEGLSDGEEEDQGGREQVRPGARPPRAVNGQAENGETAPPNASSDFIEANLQYWQNASDDNREEFYATTQKFYLTTLEEWRKAANQSVQKFQRYQTRHCIWRIALIIVTGGLAVLNVLAANEWPAESKTLALVAAVYAAILALLTTLESFFNYPDQKTTSRDSRELYLDAYRTHEMLWLSRVYAFGSSPEGCFNACTAYKQLIAKDIELRRKIVGIAVAKPK